MAAICHHFVQNAWKKDLCSNCFKSKEEHSANGGGGGGGNESRSRYLATMYPSRAYSWRREEASPQSILKDGQSPSRKPKGSGVRFPAEESQVIGFGGEECFSSDGEEDNYEPIDIGSGCDDDMMVGDGEEERALQKLTRNNTDFNTVAANLLGTSNGETKRSFTQLMLGKPLTDADGRRKTLLVSVTPFGGQEDSDPAPVSVARKTHVNKLLLEPQEKTKMIAQGGKNSDIPLDKSGDIVLKSITIKNEDDICKIEESSNKKSTDDDQSNNEINKLISKPVDIKDAISKDITIKSMKQRNELVLTVTEETFQRSEETVIKTVLQEVSNIPEIKSVSFKVDCDKMDSTPLDRSEGVISTKENVVVDDKSSKIPCLRNRLSAEKPKTILRTAAFNGRSDLQAKTEEIVPKPAIRKSCELNKGSETTNQKDEVHSVSETADSDNRITNKQTEDDGELDKIKMKKEVENSAKQTLIMSNSSNQDVVVGNNQNITLEKKTETAESQESTAKQELTETEEKKLCMGNQKSTTEFIETSNSTAAAAIVETHNLEVRTTEILTKSVTVENKTIITSNETENKLNKLDDVSINMKGDTHKMEIKFEGGSYKKLHIDEPTVQKEVSKNVSSLSVRKIEGDMFVNSVTTSVQGNDYKVAKIVVGPSELEGGKKLERDELAFRESRELAGEPDGRADPDEASEPPELPQSPPPLLDPRPSFLHSLVSGNTRKAAGDKPKIPVKPNKVLQVSSRRTPTHQAPPPVLQQQPQPPAPTPVQIEPADPALSDANGTEAGRTPKRQAPKPPPSQIEESAVPLFTRNPSSSGSSKSYSPVSREKEKRERASSCSPKIRDTVNETPSGQPSCPEPAPRRSISLSIESLTAPAVHVETEKKKSHGRARFSLRKFLRLGGSKDEDRNASTPPTKTEEVVPAAPMPRPRLEIIHPLELNGSAVEVVRSDGTNVRRNLEDSGSTGSSSSETKEAEVLSESNSQSSNSPNHMAARPNKPPPPPRNQSLDAWGKLELLNKPARPPPPKSAELLRQQKQPTAQVPVQPAAENNLYVNLGFLPGEGRSGLAPSKPQRTASIRDAHTDGPKRKTHTDDSGYEAVELGGSKQQNQNMSENVYECVGNGRSSSPECDAGINKPVRYGSPQRKSDGSMDTSPEYLKFRGSFVRSTSLPYCGSETESDIYSPYSFYGSEEGGEEDGEWPTSPGHPYKTCRLRMRKGRSIVHKSLEDNYGAVIVANHEALAQVLEQVNQFAVVPLQLRGLKTMTNLRWTDFTIAEDNRAVVSGRRAFHAAQWASHNVTVCIAMDQGLQSGVATRGPYTLAPLTEFSDLIPTRYLPIQNSRSSEELVQASVAVLTRLHVDTIHSYGSFLRERATAEDQFKEAVFVMLQLVNGLKALQAQGIEEAPLSLSSFVLCREDRDPQPRLCLLHELGASLPRGESSEDRGSLCQCALAALSELLPAAPLTPLVADILTQEKAVSLSQVKSVLEFSLWGPADVALGTPAPDRELALQRWLDLERATVLHGLVRTRVELTPLEECHLLFLVRTSSKMMSEASLLLDSQSKPETTTF